MAASTGGSGRRCCSCSRPSPGSACCGCCTRCSATPRSCWSCSPATCSGCSRSRPASGSQRASTSCRCRSRWSSGCTPTSPTCAPGRWHTSSRRWPGPCSGCFLREDPAAVRRLRPGRAGLVQHRRHPRAAASSLARLPLGHGRPAVVAAHVPRGLRRRGLNFSPGEANDEPLTRWPGTWSVSPHPRAGRRSAHLAAARGRLLRRPAQLVMLVSWVAVGSARLLRLPHPDHEQAGLEPARLHPGRQRALLASARANIVGPDIAREYRYQTESAAMFVLSVGLAFLPALGAAGRTTSATGCRRTYERPRFVAAAAAVVAVSSLVSTVPTSTCGRTATRPRPTSDSGQLPGRRRRKKPVPLVDPGIPQTCCGPSATPRTPTATSSATSPRRRRTRPSRGPALPPRRRRQAPPGRGALGPSVCCPAGLRIPDPGETPPLHSSRRTGARWRLVDPPELPATSPLGTSPPATSATGSSFPAACTTVFFTAGGLSSAG